MKTFMAVIGIVAIVCIAVAAIGTPIAMYNGLFDDTDSDFTTWQHDSGSDIKCPQCGEQYYLMLKYLPNDDKVYARCRECDYKFFAKIKSK